MQKNMITKGCMRENQDTVNSQNMIRYKKNPEESVNHAIYPMGISRNMRGKAGNTVAWAVMLHISHGQTRGIIFLSICAWNKHFPEPLSETLS